MGITQHHPLYEVLSPHGGRKSTAKIAPPSHLGPYTTRKDTYKSFPEGAFIWMPLHHLGTAEEERTVFQIVWRLYIGGYRASRLGFGSLSNEGKTECWGLY